MNFIVKTTPAEMQRARQWWADLEMAWKMAWNEVVFGVGPTVEPPHDDHLMLLLVQVDTLRFAGVGANNPNLTVKLTNLSGLIPLYHLRYLSISHTGITGLKELVRHTQMQHLFVYDNQLTSLEGIEGMTQLEDCYVQNNQLTDLRPLRKLTNLKALYASGNRLTTTDGLTPEHGDKLRKCYLLPNDDLPHREVIRLQNEAGILVQRG